VVGSLVQEVDFLSQEMEMKVSGWIAALALLGATGGALAQDVGKYDISGVKTGMTKEQAEAKLKAEYPNLKLTGSWSYPAQYGFPESLAQLEYCYGENYCSNRARIGFLPLSGKIYYIGRSEFLGNISQPETQTPIKTLIKAFEEKYGAPTGKYDGIDAKAGNSSDYILSISMDKNGVPMKRLDDCSPERGHNGPEPVVKKVSDQCNFWLYYSLQRDRFKNQDFSYHFDLKLKDYSQINSELKMIFDKKEDIEKKKIEQGAANKAPKL
jgi:hypothetical protein